MKRSNPLMEIAIASVAPFLPYIIGGVTLYFFGGRIITAIAAKISGQSVDSLSEKISSGTTTIQQATIGETASAVWALMSWPLPGWDNFNAGYTTQDKAIWNMLNDAISKKRVSRNELPYPDPINSVQLLADKTYVNQKKLITG